MRPLGPSGKGDGDDVGGAIGFAAEDRPCGERLAAGGAEVLVEPCQQFVGVGRARDLGTTEIGARAGEAEKAIRGAARRVAEPGLRPGGGFAEGKLRLEGATRRI